MTASRDVADLEIAIFWRLLLLRAILAETVPRLRSGTPQTMALIGPLQPAIAAMGGELLGQALVGRIILGDDQQAAGVLVQPVHDAGALYPANAGKAIAAMGNEGIDQGSRLIAGPGVNHEPCGLVDDDQVLVFIDHGERNGFGPWFGCHGRRDHRLHALARLQLVAGFGCGNTLDRDLAFRDKPLKAGAADLGKSKRQEAVKPVRGFDGCAEGLGGLRRHG